MNEPHDLDSCTTWFEMAQLCIDSIRTVDMDTRIMWGAIIGVRLNVGLNLAIR